MKTDTIPTVIVLMVCSLFSEINWAHGGSHGGHGGHGGSYGGGGHGGYGGHYSGGFRGGYGAGSSFGFYWGFPYYSYPYSYPYFPYSRYGYGYPYYYPPTVITVPTTPPVYIQQTPPTSRQYPTGYWYYCSAPEGYYPYIKECPNGWRQVDPTPSAPR